MNSKRYEELKRAKVINDLALQQELLAKQLLQLAQELHEHTWDAVYNLITTPEKKNGGEA